jgi:hypothetical protein
VALWIVCSTKSFGADPKYCRGVVLWQASEDLKEVLLEQQPQRPEAAHNHNGAFSRLNRAFVRTLP